VTYKPPNRPPGDRSHLERLVQALSVDQGIAADRLRRWVSTMILLGALGRVGDDAHSFLLKGGVAMELRLRLRARATKDIDIIVIPDRNADILEVLQDALDEPYLDFAFRLTGSRPIERTPALTERFRDRENDCFRDLIDLLLLQTSNRISRRWLRHAATSLPRAANNLGRRA
jgi:Nucleotidyl transferase AbiEii toxin, Type IV TA system